MTKVLFLCTANSARSQMAEGFARQYAGKGVEILSGGTEPSVFVNPLAIKVMAEAEIDISTHYPKIIDTDKLTDKDIVITLCADADTKCPLFLPGQAKKIAWNLDDPHTYEDFVKTRDKIKQLCEDFFKRGYFNAIVSECCSASVILDSLSEGIIAHDTNRKIVFFNKAAEEITGYSKKEVVGNDCHKVFPDKFCGSKCSFCEGYPDFEKINYQIDSLTKNKNAKKLDMTVTAVKEPSGKMTGVVASFRDITLEDSMARRLGKIESFAGIIGQDSKMLEVFDLIKSVADTKAAVLIEGESGTGKELVAAAIHNESNRKDGLFVPVNCGALPENLLESELFGHVKGAFTGAFRDKKGRFELANNGTIFLDEIGDISPAMQVKLLRVIQEGTFEKVGDTKTIKTDVRIISATHKNLKEQIALGLFRDDLYYRICVVPIKLPSLKERKNDIPIITRHLLNRINEESGRKLILSPPAMDTIISYDWPGNIRELQNALQFASVKCRDELIEAHHLPPQVTHSFTTNLTSSNLPQTVFYSAVNRKNRLTEENVKAALKHTGGNKAKAARLLGVGRATLYRFLSSQSKKPSL